MHIQQEQAIQQSQQTRQRIKKTNNCIVPKKKTIDAYTTVWNKEAKEIEYDSRFVYHVLKKYRKLFKNRNEARYILKQYLDNFCADLQKKSKLPVYKRLKTVSKERKGAGRKPVAERVIQTGITVYLSESDLKRIGGVQLLRAMCRTFIEEIMQGQPYYISDREHLPRPAKMKPQQITVYLKPSDITKRFTDSLTFKQVIATWFESLMQELKIENYSIARFKKEQIIKYL